MTRTLPRGTILKYYGYQAADSVGFIWPVFTLFLLWNDLTYAQIGALSAISAVLVVGLEVPTGYVADRIGRRNAMALGMGAMTVSIAGFVVATTFLEFVVLYAFWSVSLALQSGTADAWLYDTLSEALRDEEFTRIRGRGGAVYQWTSGVTMILGGFLYVVHPTYPFFASAVLNAAGVVIVLTMPRNSRFRDDGVAADRLGPRQSLELVRAEFTRPGLRSFVAYVALFFAVTRTADEYIQPITTDVLEAAFEAVSLAGAIPEETTLGFLYAGFALLAAVASYHAETVRDLVGLRRTVVWLPIAVAGCLLLPRLVPLLAIPVFLAMKGASALWEPLVTQYLNDATGSAGRATVLSAASMAYALVRAPVMPLAGFAADVVGPVSTVAWLGVAFLLLAPGVALRWTAGPEPVDQSAGST
ncbi:MFS transporter [Halopiger goleimassiliensis]|uniref:MFS transporter n=1 Tax=Halopiger goleimassiliensis TaxID=1293048 RepID=UPI0006780F50|nr:MFS transporter [Halopiger goleimassiliensis]